MKILLISYLYPEHATHQDEEISYALPNLVKNWPPGAVTVLRPVNFSLKHIFQFKKTVEVNDFDGIQVITYRMPFWTRWKLFYYKPFFKILDKYRLKPDIIVAHLAYNIFHGNILAQALRIPLVIGIHNTDVRWLEQKKHYPQYLNALGYASSIACRSLVIRKRLSLLLPEYNPKCFIAFSGIAKHLIQTEDFALHKIECWKKTKQIRFFTAGDLIPLKNIDICLEALAQLSAEYQWSYYIAGSGGEEQNLKNLVKRLGLENKVFFLGQIPIAQVLSEMQQADIFMMVSAPETFGIVYLEAMAKGALVLGSVGWGIDGFVQDRLNGFLSPPRDVSALNAKLNQILTAEESVLKAIAHSAQQTINQLTEESASINYYNELRKLVK